MGALPGGPFGPLPYPHPESTEALVNAQLCSTHSKSSSSSQGPLPIIAPKPPSLDLGNVTHFSYIGAYPGVHRANSTASLGFSGLDVHNSPYAPQHLGFSTPTGPMNHPSLFDFPVLEQSAMPRPHAGFVSPERRHTAFAIMETPATSPITPFVPSIPLTQPDSIGTLEAMDVWGVADDTDTLQFDDEDIFLTGLLDLDAHGIDSTAIGRLHGSLDLYGTSVRSFQALAEENVLANYRPSLRDSPLNDPKVAAIFWYFLHVTGPALNMYERNRPDPSRIFSGQPVPRSNQHIWTRESCYLLFLIPP